VGDVKEKNKFCPIYKAILHELVKIINYNLSRRSLRELLLLNAAFPSKTNR